MAQSCLQIIQTVCKRIGILPPNVAVTSTDPQIQQIVALSEEEGQELCQRYTWQQLQTQVTFLTVAAQVQGTLAAIAPGIKYIINDTIWNRTLRRPVYGPKSPPEWQQSIANQINGPFNSFRIIQDAINFYPNPVAGQTCAFEYMSRNWANGANGETWASDADTSKLDDQLIVLGTIWRWKQAKGLDYAEDFTKYERRVADASNRDAGKPILNMSGCQWDLQPVVIVPAGSWGVL